jgi:uncharacterized HAD superfamily protein
VERKYSKRKIVLVDIDGTLADVSHRLQFARGPRKDWGRFFAAMDRDQPINAVIEFVMRLAGKYEIVIFTGRPEDYRKKTMSWLRRHRVPFSKLLMRPARDHRPDYIVKREMVAKLGEDRIHFAVDDRPQVCDILRQLGLTVLEVSSDVRNQQINEFYRAVA